MKDRFFLDTNIFVYSFDSSAPQKAVAATDLIQRGIETHKGIVSYEVVQEFFNIALRRFPSPMSAAEAEQYLSTTFRPLMVVNASVPLFMEALRLRDNHGIPWYDSLIVAAAVEADCTILYSEDFQHGRSFDDLQIQNPFRGI